VLHCIAQKELVLWPRELAGSRVEACEAAVTSTDVHACKRSLCFAPEHKQSPYFAPELVSWPRDLAGLTCPPFGISAAALKQCPGPSGSNHLEPLNQSTQIMSCYPNGIPLLTLTCPPFGISAAALKQCPRPSGSKYRVCAQQSRSHCRPTTFTWSRHSCMWWRTACNSALLGSLPTCVCVCM